MINEGITLYYLHKNISSNINNYVNNIDTLDHNIREAAFAFQYPYAAARIGPAYDGSEKRNISTIASNFAINMTSDSSVYQGDQNEGSERNSFRHAIWQSIISKDFSNSIAQKIGNSHENSPFVDTSKRIYKNKSEADSVADLLNNDIGRSIASQNPKITNVEIANMVLKQAKTTGLYTVKSNGGSSG
jgi:hypothetical protein